MCIYIYIYILFVAFSPRALVYGNEDWGWFTKLLLSASQFEFGFVCCLVLGPNVQEGGQSFPGHPLDDFVLRVCPDWQKLSSLGGRRSSAECRGPPEEEPLDKLLGKSVIGRLAGSRVLRGRKPNRHPNRLRVADYRLPTANCQLLATTHHRFQHPTLPTHKPAAAAARVRPRRNGTARSGAGCWRHVRLYDSMHTYIYIYMYIYIYIYVAAYHAIAHYSMLRYRIT